jgi:homopolymeric O-antigen transport system ATP-binding protein
MDSIIKVRGLGKKYRLGAHRAGYDTLRERLTQSFRAPFNIKRRRNGSGEWLWALRDINFDVKPGDVIGIIGRNGAGKSTLLKILSRITEPTEGRVELFGRVGSLLEVGTGFHPELTGRENVFLNGAVLGMARREIAHKFDEIVNFAEIEKFIDTPVKHYSTGMYMRLAFAVAAHLDPEILIVDEVLAVGDAAFQKKCLEKMGAAGFEGRTVLFVSHNLAAVRTLCSRAILIEHGQIELDSDVSSCVTTYLSEHDAADAMKVWDPASAPQTPEIRFTRAYILNHEQKIVSQLDNRNDFTIAVEYEVLKPINRLRVGFYLQTVEGVTVCGSNDPQAWASTDRPPGAYVSKCTFPGSVLNAGAYVLGFGCDNLSHSTVVQPRPALNFVVEVIDGGTNRALPGVIRPRLNWVIEKTD